MSSRMADRLRTFARENSQHVLFGIKASIAPGALMCLLQSSTYINYFGTISYLPPVVAACSLPTLARARLLWFHFQLVLAFTLSYAYCLLAGYSGVKARQHSTAGPVVADAYNGSAEAVVAVYFCFYYWMVFTLKSAYVVWAVPCVLAGLYAGAVLPPQAKATTFQDVEAIGNLTIEAFLTGQAFALAVGLIILPLSSRKAFLQNIRACLAHAVSLSKTHVQLIDEMVAAGPTGVPTEQEGQMISQLKNALRAFQGGANQAKAELGLTKQELAWSRLQGSELERLYGMIANLTPLLAGAVSTAEMLHTARERDFAVERSSDKASQWQDLRYAMHKQSKKSSDNVLSNVEEILQVLDSIITGSSIKGRMLSAEPNGSTTASRLGKSSQQNYQSDKNIEHGVNRPQGEDSLQQEFLDGRSLLRNLPASEQHIRAVHYFMILGERQTLTLATLETQKLLLFLREIHALPTRLVLPNFNSILQHFLSLFNLRAATSSPKKKPNERLTHARTGSANMFRALFHFVSSKHAGFGLRGAVAVFTIGILAFLPETTEFFARQRFLWAIYAIVLSLNDTAGSSTQSLFLRFLGTLFSMLASYLVWYIPDQKIPGILVLVWIWFAILGALYMKFATQAAAFFVAIIAAIVMVGGELQIRDLGKQAVIAAGQEVYKPYVLFPYRMAIVVLGILVAFFWTIFPFPLTAHQELRQCISASLFHLAKYSVAIQETTRRRFFQDSSERCTEESLMAARRAHVSDFQRMSTTAQSLVKFLNWELRLGPVFPRETATKILALSNQLTNHMSLIENVSTAMNQSDDARSTPKIGHDEGLLLYPHLCPEGITSRLLHISGSLGGDHVFAPEMKTLDVPDITYFLSANCPASSVFITAALIHAANWYMLQDMAELTRLAVDVVGILKFREEDDA